MAKTFRPYVPLTKVLLYGPLPKTATFADRMRRKLRTKVDADVYRWRKAIVEPVFGQIKHARGLRQFRLRGVEKVRGGLIDGEPVTVRALGRAPLGGRRGVSQTA